MEFRRGALPISDWKKHAKELEAAFAAKCAHVAGLDAYLNAMKRAHPDSPVLADSNKRYTGSGKPGKVKTKGRLIYEAGFDAKARELKIARSEERRGGKACGRKCRSRWPKDQ